MDYGGSSLLGIQRWEDPKPALKEPSGRGEGRWRGGQREAQTDLPVSRVSLCRCPPALTSPRRCGMKVRGCLVHSRRLDRLRGGEGTHAETWRVSRRQEKSRWEGGLLHRKDLSCAKKAGKSHGDKWLPWVIRVLPETPWKSWRNQPTPLSATYSLTPLHLGTRSMQRTCMSLPSGSCGLAGTLGLNDKKQSVDNMAPTWKSCFVQQIFTEYALHVIPVGTLGI